MGTMQFQVGEQLVWIHIDEETGRKVNDFVKVMRAANPGGRTYGAREQYQVMVVRTNEPALAFSDELFRYQE